jgi:hypothetical protein
MTSDPGSPIDRLLTGSLVVVPLLYLLVDVRYAVAGWDDPTAGALHVIAATAYLFVLLRVVTWSPPVLGAVLLVVAVVGTAGNVGYGFNTIHVSLGDTDLVDASGAAVLIKPLGLFFPLALLLAAVALRAVAPVAVPVLLGAAAVAWPVAHIANVGWLAVVVNVVLVGAFVAVGLRAPGRRTARTPAGSTPSRPTATTGP